MIQEKLDKLNYYSYQTIHDDAEIALQAPSIPSEARLRLIFIRNRAYNMMQTLKYLKESQHD